MTRWQKIGLVTAIVLAVIVAVVVLGFRVRAGIHHVMYPVAPPMPAIISESMPEVLARLEGVLRTNAPSVLAGLQPGLSADAITKLEQQYTVQIPDDVKAIYEWHDGMANRTNLLSEGFIPGHIFSSLEETLTNRAMEWSGATGAQKAVGDVIIGYRKSWICLFDDGAGDGYWFDPQRRPSEGAVFYNFTEDAQFVFFPSAKNLMAGVARCYETGAFHMKSGTASPELEEDFALARKLWEEFGASNLSQLQ